MSPARQRRAVIRRRRWRLLDAEGRVAGMAQDCFYKVDPVRARRSVQPKLQLRSPVGLRLAAAQMRSSSCVAARASPFRRTTPSRTRGCRPGGRGHPGTARRGAVALRPQDLCGRRRPRAPRARRIKRDMETRGRDLGGILEQYEKFVKPATESFVVPTGERGHHRPARRGERRGDRDAGTASPTCWCSVSSWRRCGAGTSGASLCRRSRSTPPR